jgi:GTP-binding protein HflX
LTDTVGFIRKLPTQLVESFKGTLDEVREADLLMHIVDISHPSFEDHIASVNKILDEIDGSNKPVLMVFNKIDAFKPNEIDQDDLVTIKTESHYSLEDWKNTWMNRVNGDAVFISALEKENLEEFRQTVYNKVKDIHVARFPYNSFLFADYSQYQEEE